VSIEPKQRAHSPQLAAESFNTSFFGLIQGNCLLFPLRTSIFEDLINRSRLRNIRNHRSLFEMSLGFILLDSNMSDRVNTDQPVCVGQGQPSSGLGRRLTIVALVVGLAAAVLLMSWARAFYGSAEAYRKGKESLQQGQVMQAITFFDRAIHWYAPFNPYVEKSAQRLWELGEDSEKRGEHTLALAALTSLKSGYVAAAGLFTPGRDWIKRCEDRIKILSKVATQAGSDREVAPVQKGLPPPSVFWTLVLEVGLLGWIGWIIWMIASFRRKDPLLVSLLRWGVPLFLFYAMWIIGMMRA
jgi:hypothetical protein